MEFNNKYILEQTSLIKKQLIKEDAFNIGSKSYTDRNLTPTDILELAFFYSKFNIGKLPKKLDHRIKIFADLKKLIGMDYNYTTKKLEKSTKPAWIVHLLKTELVTKDEYIKLYGEFEKVLFILNEIIVNDDTELINFSKKKFKNPF